MKVTLSNLGDEFLQDYKLVKKIDNSFINETIEGNVIYEGDKNTYLLESAINGNDKEIGNITYPCGLEMFDKAIMLSHKNGTFNFGKCRVEKPIKFNTPLDCVAEGEINIFDYPASETESVQGELIKSIYGDTKLYFDFSEVNVLNLDFCLSFMGGIPNKENEGLYPEYVHVYATPIINDVEDEFGTGQLYIGHEIELYVSYVGLKSITQISNKWVLIDGFYWYNGFTIGDWTSPYFAIQEERNTLGDISYFTEKRWVKGILNTYIDLPISNTINFNEVLKGVFECTGFNVVSNFFGIAPDATNPDNKYYQYAIEQYQDLRIVESYDIIRESALDDSFGQSGLLPNKDLITDLCIMFNLLIYPDVTNSLIRIEHISYYTTKGINLDSRDYEVGEFNLNKDEIDIETFQYAQPTPSKGFYSISVNYRNLDLFKEENEKIYKTKRIVTDVFGTLNNKDFENEQFKPLFYLLATDGTSIIELNNSLSIESLFYNLHDLNRPIKSGFVGSNKVDFGGYSIGLSSEIKIKGSPIMWNNINPMFSVITKYGTFLIEEIDIDKNNLITLKIKK